MSLYSLQCKLTLPDIMSLLQSTDWAKQKL